MASDAEVQVPYQQGHLGVLAVIDRRQERAEPGRRNVSSRSSSRLFRDPTPSDDGAHDGFPDQLFRFPYPVTGTSVWRPPVRGGGLDLSAVL